MSTVVKTAGRVAAGVFTLGLSEVVGSMTQKPTDPGMVAAPKEAKTDESKLEEQEKLKERRRRQMIASQNRMIQTSPLGASIQPGLLGGNTLTGE